jgi:hypothetical protein
LVAFWELFGVFLAAFNIKVLVSGYPSIDMHLIVLPVRFEGGLSIQVLRNKQLFKKLDIKKFRIFSFQPPPFEDRTDLGKAECYRQNRRDRTNLCMLNFSDNKDLHGEICSGLKSN